MRVGPGTGGLVLGLHILLGTWSPAAAQGGSHPTWDAPGFKDGRAHDGQEPWESIDTLNGGVTLRFTDFDLPGDNGFRLRVQRVWNSKGPTGWRMGLADVPMWIRNHDAVWGPPTAQSGFGTGYPILEMLDGTEHHAVESPVPNMWKTGEHAYFRKDGGALRVDLPNGLVCYYVVPPQPGYGGQTQAYLRKIDNRYGDVAELFWQDGSATTPPILTGIDHFVANESGQTRTAQNRAFRSIDFAYDPGSTLPQNVRINLSSIYSQWDYEWGATATAWDPANARKWYFEPAYNANNGLTSMKVTTPYGGEVTYTFQLWNIANDPVVGNIQTTVVTARAVKQSSTAPAHTWTYSYPFYAGGGGTTTVTGPDNTQWLHGYGPGGGYPIGDANPLTLLARITRTPAGTVRRDERLAYEGYNYSLTGGGVALSQREIVQDGRCYRTTYGYSQDALAFGDFSQPRTITESTGPNCGALSVKRSTVRTYNRTWMAPGAAPFFSPQLATESVTAGAHTYDNAFFYNGDAFLTYQSLAGEKSQFDWDARGNRAWETRSWDTEDPDAASNATNHVFEYGAPKTTTIPKGVNAGGGTMQISRTIDLAYGLTLSESRGGSTTGFEFDGLGRPTLVTPPAGFGHPTFITYGENQAGASTVTEQRSATGTAAPPEDYRERTFTLNGFGRVVKIVDAKNIVVDRVLDAYGREVTSGLPGAGSSTWGSGTLYDVLDRITQVTTADGVRAFDYANGDLKITDEKGRITDHARSAFGTPEDFQTVQVIKRSVPDENGTVGDLAFQYSYNAVGRLLTVGATFNGAAVPSAGRSFTYEPGRPRLLVSETHPESGQTTYTYNARALLASKTPAGLTTQTYGYDRAGRLYSITRPGDLENVQFEYDDRDNRTRATTGYVDTSWQWDLANRMNRRQDSLLRLSATDPTATALSAITFDYNDFDNLTQINYPVGGFVVNTYDRADRLETARLNGAAPYLYDVKRFHPSGAPEYIKFGNGTWDVRTYDARHRLDTMCTETGTADANETCNDADAKLQHRDYRYDAAGNVDEAQNLVNTLTTQTFTYDALDRLRTFNWPAVTTLAYDVLGNQRREQRSGQPDILSGYANGRLATLTQGSYAENPQYDARGNTIHDGLSSAPYVYSSRDMMLSSTIAGATTAYTYDADQNRVSKTKNGVTTLYVRGPGGTVLSEGERVGATVAWKRNYVYAGSKLVASIVPAPPPPPQQTIVVTATALTPTVTETAGTATVRLSFQTSDGQVVATARSLTFATVNGTASSSGAWPDLTATTRVVTLPQNSPSLQTVDVAIPIVDNCINEPTEAFSFALSSPPTWVTGTLSASLNIADNDPIAAIYLSVDPVDTTVAEGVNPSVTAQLRVWTSAACTTHDVSVVVQKQNGSVMLPGVPAATAGSDYDGTAISVLVPAGTPNGATIPGVVTILNDGFQEVTEAFSLALTSLGGGNVFIKPADASRPRYDVASVRIRDDDAVAVGFMASTHWAYEVNGSVMVSAQVITDYQGPTLTPVTVSYSSAGGSATSGTDFTPVSGSFVIPAGTPHGTIYQAPVPIFNDGMGEPSETFSMSLTVSGGFTYPVAQQTIYIADNDPAGITTEIDFVTTSQTVAESTGVAWFTVRVLTANGQPVATSTPLWAQTFPYNTNPGAPWATPNVDFQALPPSWFPIAAGTANCATASLALSIANDGVAEPAEQFRLDLTSAAPGVTVFNAHTVTIANGTGFRMSGGSQEVSGSARPAPKKSDLGKWFMEGTETVTPKTIPWTKVP